MERLKDVIARAAGPRQPRCCTLVCFAALAMTALMACTSSSATLTLVNSGPQDIKINVDEKPHTVRAGGFVNVTGLKGGDHYIKVANAPVQTVALSSRRSTVMDLSGEGCYVVVNFTPQYEPDAGGEIGIEERFKKQPLFTPQEAMTVPYGDPLPRKVDVGSMVRRLHAIDCSVIEVDRAILEAVSRLP